MTAIRILLLCLAAAMICTMLRPQRPEMAAMVSLAVGLAALLMVKDAFGDLSQQVRCFIHLASVNAETSAIILKTAGITILTELGVQICTDAGESALAGRIRLAARIVILGMALPLVMQIVDSVGTLLV